MKGISAILFTAFIFISFSGKGQCPSDKGQIEITASYGMITGDQIAGSILTNDNGQFTKSIAYNSGAPFITARYFLYNRLAIGFSGGVTNERLQYNDPYNPSFNPGSYKQTSTTVAFEVYYIYMFRKYIEVYTFAGLGPSFINSEQPVVSTTNTLTTVVSSHDELKVQYTPIGVRAGGRLGAFAELGIGYKGLLNAGVSFKLGPSCWWKEDKQ